MKDWNDRLYEDILPANYGTSYGNPAYAVSVLGEEYGQLLSFLYTEESEVLLCMPMRNGNGILR